MTNICTPLASVRRTWILSACFGLALIIIGLYLSGQPDKHAWFFAVNQWRLPFRDSLAANLTILGMGYAPVIVMLACDRRSGVGTALALRTLLLTAIAARLSKHWIHSPRPLSELDPSLVHVIGTAVSSNNSLPSGHTMTAFAAATALALLACVWLRTRSAPRLLAGLWALPLLVAAGVGWSRIAVGAHWVSDVVAGAGVGMLMAALAASWEAWRPWSAALATPLAQRILAVFEIALALVWLNVPTGFADALGLQVLTGVLGLASGVLRWSGTMRPLAAPSHV